MKINDFIVEFQIGQENAVSSFVRRVFDEFVAPDYSEEGNNTFYDYIDPQKIKERIESGVTFILYTMEGNDISGMIEIRNNDHISLLFVDKKYQGKGIARDLYKKSIEICLKNSPGPIEFTVNSSPFAVEIYEKLGFTKIEEEKTLNGIRYIPMKMVIKGK
jgi:GNAT superfamily N-acetyltransferase